MTDHLLREDCGYELLYTKQLNQEQCESPMGRKMGGGRGRCWRRLGAGWSWRGGLVEMVVAACGISASQILMDSGQVCAQSINTPRYISHQSLSICCLQKASMVLKPQSPSDSFQVSSSRTSHTFSEMDLLSAAHEGRVPGPLHPCGLHTQPSMSPAPLRPAHWEKWLKSDPI